ncbi:MAG: ATP-binding protein [Planctomycetaceae bacterium]|jgi:AAA+ ATPase superfamily predicted ATPase|nr:ATP-binding protein [Planctomycetaceae bacterium]
MENPFKFGTVVDDKFFTDRKEEIEHVKQVLNSNNHLIIISPRRFGKTSLIRKVTKNLNRKIIYLDLQLITDTSDFAAQLLKRVLNVNKWEKIKQLISHFRIVPTISLNPLTNGIDVSFQPTTNHFVVLEDVLNLIEKTGKDENKPVVVLDEFQEIQNINKNMDRQLRSVLQQHQFVNYVFLGSMESMMKDIFEDKKSPFYHFGYLMTLKKIPGSDFFNFLEKRFLPITPESRTVSEQILKFTECHPFYTQQLAFYCWNHLQTDAYNDRMLETVVTKVTREHDTDYERLWNTLNKTDKKIMIELSLKNHSPLQDLSLSQPTSTIYSGIKRLLQKGYIVKNEEYEPDDPFFKKWIADKRTLLNI